VILVDTSIWIDHLVASNVILADLLANQCVLGHPYVTGELALGHLRRRDLVLRNLQRLPQAVVASHREAMHLIREESLFGLEIGYVDVHLLASARMTAGASLWTRDRSLHAAAMRLRVAQRLFH
jgi:predicted nucleic acid-binding protein